MPSSEAITIIKGHCPQCGPDRNADVVGHFHTRGNVENEPIWWRTDYRILQCRGCESVYFQEDFVFSEDIDWVRNPDTGEFEESLAHKISYWPAPAKREKPAWSHDLAAIDRDLHSLFEDIYVALNSDLRVLSAIGIRTAFDRASELLGINPEKGFAQKLVGLHEQGKIGSSERESLKALTDAGSAAAHRGWRPEPEELGTMMSIIEGFLYRTFVLDAEAKKLRQKVPERERPEKP